jgi:hypothetical protein
MRPSEENVLHAGIVFMFSVWLQGQMSDLVILKKNTRLIPDFVANPARVPSAFSIIRMTYWEKQFGDVKQEFVTEFGGQLLGDELQDIEQIFHLRNMIAHSHVSFGREYMLYRPSSEKKERAVISSLGLKAVNEQSNPLVIKLQFSRDDSFQKISDQIERIDRVCLSRLAASLGIPHGRIR